MGLMTGTRSRPAVSGVSDMLGGVDRHQAPGEKR
jgi:hypothetical protein